MKTTKTRYFIVAPGNEYGYKDVLGFVVYPDGRAKRFRKNKKPPFTIGDRCSKEETLSDHKLGRLIEIPEEFMLCVRFFIVAPGRSGYFYRGTIGFKVSDGRVKRFYTREYNGPKDDIAENPKDILAALRSGSLIEVPEAEFVLCI